MSTQNLIPIDGEKLKMEIIKRGLSFKQIDEELGFAHGYTSRTTIRKSATLGFIKMLEKLYDIPFSDYEPGKPNQEEDQPAVAVEVIKPETHIIHDIINLSELKHVIYDAVYQAVLDAWKDDEPSMDIEKEDDKGLINGVPYV